MGDVARRISAGELHEWFAEGRDFVCLDVLLPEVFEARHIPGARSACVFEVEFPQHVRAVVDDQKRCIVVYGEDEETCGADVAAEKLIRLGYSEVRVLAGGIGGWISRGYDVDGTGRMPEGDALRLDDGTYHLDADASTFLWSGRNHNSKHTGTLRVSRGVVDISGGGMHGEFMIRLASLQNSDLEDATLRDLLVQHLLSDDFFFAEHYPEAVFTLEAGIPLHGAYPGQANYDLRGQLTLRGKKLPLSLRAVFANIEDDALAVHANFDFDRTQWGVMYGSGRFFKNLGYHLVYDMVSVEMRLVLRKA